MSFHSNMTVRRYITYTYTRHRAGPVKEDRVPRAREAEVPIQSPADTTTDGTEGNVKGNM